MHILHAVLSHLCAMDPKPRSVLSVPQHPKNLCINPMEEQVNKETLPLMLTLYTQD